MGIVGNSGPMAFWVEWALAAAIIIIAFFMTVCNLPGNTVMMFTCLLFAFFDEARYFDIRIISAMILFYAFGEIWEFCVSFFGIKREKVSWWAVGVISLGTLGGTLAGTAFIPVLGSVIGGACGAFGVAYLYEYFRTRSRSDAVFLAWKAAKNQFIAIVGKLVATFAMALLLARQIFFFQ
jgi:hypothetical protein